MPKKKMMVEWDDDAQLSESRKKPGQKSPLTRDANNKLSHVTLSEVPDDERPATLIRSSSTCRIRTTPSAGTRDSTKPWSWFPTSCLMPSTLPRSGRPLSSGGGSSKGFQV